jgi:hypothetical protein
MEIGRAIRLPALQRALSPSLGTGTAGGDVAAARRSGADMPVERVVQGELLHREAPPAAFSHALYAAARAVPHLGGARIVRTAASDAVRGIAAYRAHQQLFASVSTPASVDEYV